MPKLSLETAGQELPSSPAPLLLVRSPRPKALPEALQNISFGFAKKAKDASQESDQTAKKQE